MKVLLLNTTQAKAELGDSVTWPVRIDIVYVSDGAVREAQANAKKASIEDTLGTSNVVVNLVPADGMGWLYACYYAEHGYDINSDYSDISGWGADYGDPLTYLSLFDKDYALLTKVSGLDEFDGTYDGLITVTKQPASVTKASGAVASFTAEAFSPVGSLPCYGCTARLRKIPGRACLPTTVITPAAPRRP